MKVYEVMTRSVSWASPRDSIRQIAELMKDAGAGFIPVCEDGSVVGVITDRDIVLRCLAEGHTDNLNESAGHCMSTDVATINEDADLEHAATLMEQREIRRLPVVKDGRLVGVLSHGNLVQATRSEGAGDAATLGVTRGA
jgi:CBS domain-containing protein